MVDWPSDYALLSLQPPVGQNLTVGPYEAIADFSPTNLAAGIRFERMNLSGCDIQTGRVVVLEATYDSGSNMVNFAADFEERCNDGSEVYGEIRYNSAAPMTADKAPTASTPDAFALPARTGVLTGQRVTSNIVTAYGIRAPAAISVTGGEYSVNGGPFTAVAGAVSNRDRVVVGVVAPATTASTASAVLTIGGVAATFDVTTYVAGAPFTAISVESGTPSAFNGASSVFAQAPDWSITASASQQGHQVHIVFANASHTQYVLDLQAPLNQQLAAGPYEEAYPGSQASPAMFFGSWCASVTFGRFVIHEVSFGTTSNTIDTLAASFEWRCNGAQPVFGEVRINSTMPLPAMLSAPRTMPYPFAFNAQSPVRPGTIVQSNLTTIDGIDQPVPISITGGEYSLNGGPFTALTGTVNPRDDVVVRTTSSMAAGAVQSATLTAGGRSAILAVTTYQQGMSLSGMYYRSPPGDFVGLGQTRLLLAPPGSFTIQQDSRSAINATLIPPGAEAQWTFDVAAPEGGPVVPGTYENAMRWPFQSPSSPGLDFSNGNGCNELTGRYVVYEATYANDGTPQRFAADFEQRCENVGPALYGEIRFNSTVPFSALLLPPTTPLSNISTRGGVLTGENVLIGGFVVGGSTNKTVAITAMGPSLANFGVSNPLANPVITLVRSSDQSIVAGNDDWQSDANASQLQASGFAPPNALESGLLVNLPPGGYTVIVQGAGASTGVAVVGVFEVDHPETPLANIATRGLIGTGENVLIGGFIVHGTGPQTVAIVGTGPSLGAFGVANPLANPTLTLVRSSDQSIIATNDDWQSAPNWTYLLQSGFAPSDSRESGLLMSLEPGAYTAILSGAGGTTGVGVIAVYTVQ
jgi:uncharacterized protein (DUF1330 family)